MRALVLASAVALAGCHASIDRFETSERYVCPGRAVTIDWKATGSAKLAVDPAPPSGAAAGSVDDEGSVTIAPVESTKVTLTVSRFLGSSASAEIDIGVDAGVAPLTASLGDNAASPGCDDDAGAVWATVHATSFAPALSVGTVTASRAYDVTHAGRSARVAPGVASAAFAGTTVDGDWTLRAPLAAGETCGPSLPRSLVIDVRTACAGGTP